MTRRLTGSSRHPGEFLATDLKLRARGDSNKTSTRTKRRGVVPGGSGLLVTTGSRPPGDQQDRLWRPLSRSFARGGRGASAETPWVLRYRDQQCRYAVGDRCELGEHRFSRRRRGKPFVVHEEFKELCEDSRFEGLSMRLKRQVDRALPLQSQQTQYAIVVRSNDMDLDPIAELQRFAMQRGLRTHLHETGQIELQRSH